MKWGSPKQYADYYTRYLKIDRRIFMIWLERENPALHKQVLKELRRVEDKDRPRSSSKVGRKDAADEASFTDASGGAF